MSLIKADFTKGEILGSGAWYGASTIFMRGIAALNTFVVIYFLTLYEYGAFKLLLSLVGIFQVFVLSGLDDVVRNEIAQHIKNNQEKSAAQLFFELLLVKGLLATTVWLLLVITIKFYFIRFYPDNFINIMLLASFTLLLNFLNALFYMGVGSIALMIMINSVI